MSRDCTAVRAYRYSWNWIDVRRCSRRRYGASVALADLVPIGPTAPTSGCLPRRTNWSHSPTTRESGSCFIFYPKDQTSGCTHEAHKFQGDLSKYEALHAVELGVSLGTVESHKSSHKDSVTFTLLADPDRKVIDAYGVPIRYGAMHYAERTTFLISPSGKVVKE
jgi:thioredoxin-dependent peroxiredoxin